MPAFANTFQTLLWILEIFLMDLIASLPRRVTRGPLDAPDDPLATATAPASTTSASEAPPSPVDASVPSSPETKHSGHGIFDPPPKDFSFLLRPEIYHPLSQLEIPAQFRTHFPPAPDADLKRLLATGHFLPAAALAVTLLTSPTLSPTNANQIFFLLHTRLACLTLTGNLLLAAQESKCLEDLNSNYYYAEPIGGTQAVDHDLEHMCPWELRVLAVRLQSIGFSDGRRGVGGYYELGTEARQKFHKATTPSETELWKSRLSDLGIRVINAQIEMGDLSGAQQELENQMRIEMLPTDPAMTFRLVLLLLRIGNVRQARKILGPKPLDGTEGVLLPLLSMAEGDIETAVKQWEDLNLQHVDSAHHALISQNLAVCYLYAGRMKDVCSPHSSAKSSNHPSSIPSSLSSFNPSPTHSAISHPSSSLLSLINGSKARAILENLVDDSNVSAFHSLTFNLATLYELCSEKSRVLKGRLVERVARKSQRADDGFEVCEEGWEKVNADFKL